MVELHGEHGLPITIRVLAFLRPPKADSGVSRASGSWESIFGAP